MYQYDSRKIKAGETFICLPKGESYIEEALKNGASDVINMTRAEMAKIADEYYHSPSKTLCVIGVTGTNGKTSVTQFVYQALKTIGFNPCVVGTLNAALTTPESLDLQKMMSEHLKQGGTHFIMEVSSHAIVQDRVKHIYFDVKCLTNLTQDHLDFHGTIEAYHQVKKDFMETYPGISVLPEDFLKEDLLCETKGLASFHVENLKAAQAILKALKLKESEIKKALKETSAPEGRFEQIEDNQKGQIIIDYAHTPDGLLKVLKEAKVISEKRSGIVRVVFGCGGERDKSKRPQMGHIAETYAGEIILTSDNPRSESEEAIISDIAKGIEKKEKVTQIKDRKEAIAEALRRAKKEDVTVIAGKGHESVQVLKEKAVPFHDKSVVLDFLKREKNGH